MSAEAIADEEEALGKAYDTRLMSWLWQFVKPYWAMIVFSILVVFPIFLLELAPAWIVKHGLDAIVATRDAAEAGAPSADIIDQVVDAGFIASLLEAPEGMATWVWLALVYAFVSVAGAALQFANMVIMAMTGQYAMRDLRVRIFAHLEDLHLGYFDRIPVGRLVTRVTNDVENVAEMFSAGIVALVTDIAKMVGFGAMLFIVDAELALATFSVVPLFMVAAWFFRLKIREAFREVRVKIAHINAVIQETITGIKVVQLFTREKRNYDDFDAVNAEHRDAWKKSIHYDSLLFSAVEAAEGLTVAIIVWQGTGMAAAGTLYVFVAWMRRFFLPLRDLSAKYSVMQSSMASTERLAELMNTEPEVKDPAAKVWQDAQTRELESQRGSVVFENVWFAYQGEEWILKDVSFRVEPRGKVAFVGATGAGKTTIIKLLTRLYDVTRGRILVDGIDVREMPQQVLRRRVATVLQDVVLFSGSVADNIDLGRLDVGLPEVEAAAEAVEASSFIERLPRGYQTEVRERGSNFSTGERQLLSFSRALAHGSDILVLDEATSSVDSETERLIQRGIHTLMQDRTSIAIAHRLSTIRDVDTIHVLRAGELVESGTHEELLALGGAYADLHRLQNEGQEAPPVSAPLAAPANA
ncbi:MAG: ABC transporter ATP-binding protein [Myxococcota bacterium]|jgi:ABC-type multidrug transport system fused ATPase/permease subunit|nr:ABC transporter ATP-binding protein [Myxococcota bacterium]